VNVVKAKLKVFRAMRDLTQEALANEIGVTRQTVIAIEKGKYNPSLEIAFKLARYVDTSIEDIFVFEPEEFIARAKRR
jgi:putative transcriptional regulator